MTKSRLKIKLSHLRAYNINYHYHIVPGNVIILYITNHIQIYFLKTINTISQFLWARNSETAFGGMFCLKVSWETTVKMFDLVVLTWILGLKDQHGVRNGQKAYGDSPVGLSQSCLSTLMMWWLASPRVIIQESKGQVTMSFMSQPQNSESILYI